MKFNGYDLNGFFDEMFDGTSRPRLASQPLMELIESLPDGDLMRRQKAAEASLFNMGVTFLVYGHEAGTEKIWPFDLLPRVISAGDWKTIDQGLRQRITALNLFIDDVYHDQK